MSYLFWGSIILLSATLLFYIIFFCLVYYWHVKKETFVVVPLLFTFDFFLVAFLIMGLAVILLNYLPPLLKAFVL